MINSLFRLTRMAPVKGVFAGTKVPVFQTPFLGWQYPFQARTNAGSLSSKEPPVRYFSESLNSPSPATKTAQEATGENPRQHSSKQSGHYSWKYARHIFFCFAGGLALGEAYNRYQDGEFDFLFDAKLPAESFSAERIRLEKTLALQEQIYGVQHVEVARALMALGDAHEKSRGYAMQAALQERAFSILENHYPGLVVEKALLLVKLSEACAHLGQPEKQKALIEQALEMQKKHYGSSYEQEGTVALTRVALARSYIRSGNHRDAKRILEASLPILKRVYQEDSVEVAQTLCALAQIHGQIGDKNNLLIQETLLKQALENYKRKDDWQGIVSTLSRLATVAHHLGPARQKIRVLKRLLAIEEKLYEPGSSIQVFDLIELGEAYGCCKEYAQQKLLIEQARSTLDKFHGSEHSLMPLVLSDLSTVQLRLGDLQKAKQLAEEAMVLQEKYHAANPIQTIKILANSGDVYGALGDFAKQKAVMERSVSLLEKHSENMVLDHGPMQRYLRGLVAAYVGLGENEKAQGILEKANAVQADSRKLGFKS